MTKKSFVAPVLTPETTLTMQVVSDVPQDS